MPRKRIKKSKWIKFFYSRWFFVVVLGLIVFVALVFLKSYYQDYQMRQEIRRLQEEAERLEGKKIQLLELIKYVRTENFVEDRARTDFNMAKPGERAVIITSAGESLEKSGQVDNKVVEWKSISNPIKWWKLFFNKNN